MTLLALNHVSTRHPLGQLRDEARAMFPDTVVPRDFDTIEIPFPERGEPTLVRWSERRAAEQLAAPAAREEALAPQALDTPRMSGEPHALPEHEAELVRAHARPARLPHAVAVGRPAEPADVRSLADKREHWERHGFGLWLLRDRHTGRAGRPRRPAVHRRHRRLRGGGGVGDRPRALGRGLATELALASVAVAFDLLGLDELIAITLPDNIASRRVMEKSGFVVRPAHRARGAAHGLECVVPDPTRPVALVDPTRSSAAPLLAARQAPPLNPVP